ncbi:MAG TPA: hypothetical protein VF342_07325 [Alphaproteobacteria bacterium]
MEAMPMMLALYIIGAWSLIGGVLALLFGRAIATAEHEQPIAGRSGGSMQAR